MRILIIDGQGGGVGSRLTEEISREFPQVELTVVGTNAMATANMMKAAYSPDNGQAQRKALGATGENAVVYNCRRADIIVGPAGIIMANAMMGEITPAMAEAVSSSEAQIILIPMNKCHAKIVGLGNKKLGELIQEAVQLIGQYIYVT